MMRRLCRYIRGGRRLAVLCCRLLGLAGGFGLRLALAFGSALCFAVPALRLALLDIRLRLGARQRRRGSRRGAARLAALPVEIVGASRRRVDRLALDENIGGGGVAVSRA